MRRWRRSARGVFLIGVSSHEHASNSTPEHPARHPTKQNLHDLVDIAIDCKVPIGDALVSVPGMSERIGAVSTFANAFALNCLVIRTVAKLVGARHRAAGLAQRQRAGWRRSQCPLHRALPRPGALAMSDRLVVGRDPETGQGYRRRLRRWAHQPRRGGGL